MTKLWVRIISVVEIVGGVSGLIMFASEVLKNPPGSPAVIALYLVLIGMYLLSLYAGVALWLGRPSGRIASINETASQAHRPRLNEQRLAHQGAAIPAGVLGATLCGILFRLAGYFHAPRERVLRLAARLCSTHDVRSKILRMKGVTNVKKTTGLCVSLLVLCALLVPSLAACGPDPTPLPTETPVPPPPTNTPVPPTATPVPPTDTPIPPTDTPPPPPTDTPEPANLFKPEGGGFSIVPPYPLQETSQTVETDAGPLELHMFTAEQGQKVWLVGYSDYPEAMVQAGEPATILAGVRDGAVGNVNGQLVSDAEVTLNGYPGREFSATVTLNGQEMVMRERAYLVGNRLYQILVIVPKGEESGQEAEGFFQSFQLTAE